MKADLVIVSKSQFQVLAPYDAQLVSIFKRIPSRIYGGWLGLCLAVGKRASLCCEQGHLLGVGGGWSLRTFLSGCWRW